MLDGRPRYCSSGLVGSVLQANVLHGPRTQQATHGRFKSPGPSKNGIGPMSTDDAAMSGLRQQINSRSTKLRTGAEQAEEAHARTSTTAWGSCRSGEKCAGAKIIGSGTSWQAWFMPSLRASQICYGGRRSGPHERESWFSKRRSGRRRVYFSITARATRSAGRVQNHGLYNGRSSSKRLLSKDNLQWLGRQEEAGRPQTMTPFASHGAAGPAAAGRHQ